ncbi:Zinc finger C2H2 type [Gracilaria domingensis]|nr:Zinc finger C2H2 type [Gracilaria domingensis]
MDDVYEIHCFQCEGLIPASQAEYHRGNHFAEPPSRPQSPTLSRVSSRSRSSRPSSAIMETSNLTRLNIASHGAASSSRPQKSSSFFEETWAAWDLHHRIQSPFQEDRESEHGSSSSLSAQRHTCLECNKSYAQRSSLLSHIRSVHEKDPKLQCQICGQRFHNVTKKSEHDEKAHRNSENARYKCQWCGRAYKYQGRAMTHERECLRRLRPPAP